MPQLRAADTSTLLAEAPDVLDLLAIAREIGFDRVIFDDVVPGFDPQKAIADLVAREERDDITAKQQSIVQDHANNLQGAVAESIAQILDDGVLDPEPVVVDPAPLLVEEK